MARPKLAPDEIRNIDISIAVNEKEFKKISVRAKAAKKRVSPFVRATATGDKHLKIVPEVNQEAAGNIRQILNYLTQITGFLEQSGMSVFDPIFFIEMQKDMKQIHYDFLNYGDD